MKTLYDTFTQRNKATKRAEWLDKILKREDKQYTRGLHKIGGSENSAIYDYGITISSDFFLSVPFVIKKYRGELEKRIALLNNLQTCWTKLFCILNILNEII